MSGSTAYASDLPAPPVYLVEIVGSNVDGSARPPPMGMLTAAPMMSIGLPSIAGAAVSAIRMSDRGYIAEPTDAVAPNRAFPARLLAPPDLLFGIPIYPDVARRSENGAGEIKVANGDGALEMLAGDWAVAGRQVVIRRGPHRRPRQAAWTEMATLAEMRVLSALDGASQLTVSLKSAAADLSVAACRTYLGTGVIEGPAELAGQFKPRLFGIRRAFTPVLINAGSQIYQVNDGPMQQVLEVRNRGVLQTPTADYVNYGALATATLASGSYATSLAEGLIRTGSTPSTLLVSARGDSVLGYDGSPAGIAVAILRGPGGLSSTRANTAAFTAWPTGESGLLVTGGTVADAMERVAAGIFGWWGADASGNFRGGRLTDPADTAPAITLQPWMFRAAPQEVAQTRAPWWRSRVAYQSFDTVSSGEDVAGAVSDADRAYLSRETPLAQTSNPSIQSQYAAAAEDGPILQTIFDNQVDASALAVLLLKLFGQPRRSWTLSLMDGTRGITPQALMPGTAVTAIWPRIGALASGRPVMCQQLSISGDRLEMLVWG